MKLFQLYNTLINQHPIKTKTISCCILYGLGDGICQNYIDKKTKYDFRRTLNMSLVGLLGGPILHYWYSAVLPSIVLTQIPRLGLLSKVTKLQEVLIQVTLDQTAFACFFTIYFYLSINYFQYGNFQKGIEALQDKFWVTLKTNWLIWPAAWLVGFSIVPNQYRVLWSNFIGLFWNSILSYIQNNKQKTE